MRADSIIKGWMSKTNFRISNLWSDNRSKFEINASLRIYIYGKKTNIILFRATILNSFYNLLVKQGTLK